MGADIGGKDAHVVTNESIVRFRLLLRKHCRAVYSNVITEIALVLRVDGSVQAWGLAGVHNVKFQKKRSFATADIFVPVSGWLGCSVDGFNEFIASGVVDAVEVICEMARDKRIDVDAELLKVDVNSAARDFLGGSPYCFSDPVA
ncbi:hypothetical protein [Xanthomonas sp. SHU 166]|uniref:hypothetical protein n=1 Tax=Xanthomonas sp. SHU 166 TaxID=1591170 RepID=UPI0012FF3753|nr:hypothetical protein [Xanthomonas sp. SHU 166]